jgi:pSer/pThr/pTyr-binding forkhead associated (FHA) protein
VVQCQRTTKTSGRKKLNDIVLRDSEQFISRNHVYIISRRGQHFVADSNSCNGTRLQGREIKGLGEMALNEGDTIEIEGLELVLGFKQLS